MSIYSGGWKHPYSRRGADPHTRLSLPEGGADVGKPKLLVLLEMGRGRRGISGAIRLLRKGVEAYTKLVCLGHKMMTGHQITPPVLNSLSH